MFTLKTVMVASEVKKEGMDNPLNEPTRGRLVGEELDEQHPVEEALRRSEER